MKAFHSKIRPLFASTPMLSFAYIPPQPNRLPSPPPRRLTGSVGDLPQRCSDDDLPPLYDEGSPEEIALSKKIEESRIQKMKIEKAQKKKKDKKKKKRKGKNKNGGPKVSQILHEVLVPIPRPKKNSIQEEAPFDAIAEFRQTVQKLINNDSFERGRLIFDGDDFIWDMESLQLLANALQRNTTVTALCFFDQNLPRGGATFIFRALRHNTTLKELHFSNVDDIDPIFTDETVTKSIYELLSTNKNLKKLDLIRTGVGDRDAIAIARALENHPTLEDLDLGQDIPDALDLNAKYIGAAGLKAIAALLRKNKTLTTLNLMGSVSNGFKDVIEALKSNTTITKLRFNHSDLTAELVTAIADMLEENIYITDFEFEMDEEIFDEIIDDCQDDYDNIFYFVTNRNKILNDINVDHYGKEVPSFANEYRNLCHKIQILQDKVQAKPFQFGLEFSPSTQIKDFSQKELLEATSLFSEIKVICSKIGKCKQFPKQMILNQISMAKNLYQEIKNRTIIDAPQPNPTLTQFTYMKTPAILPPEKEVTHSKEKVGVMLLEKAAAVVLGKGSKVPPKSPKVPKDSRFAETNPPFGSTDKSLPLRLLDPSLSAPEVDKGGIFLSFNGKKALPPASKKENQTVARRPTDV